MQRLVSCHLAFDVDSPVELVLSVAVADGAWDVQELLTVHGEHGPFPVDEVKTGVGTRVHRLRAPAGRLVVDYQATVTGQTVVPPVEDVDLIEYLRPSRYADSDRLLAFAHDQFGDVPRDGLLAEVTGWVGRHVRYLSGGSLPTDGATDTLLKRRGVCRDFAHLVVALLRALDVPARVASVYAPGLEPMDFHAVAEAYVDGGWHVLDATGLADRRTMVRIATGRDATDTAFCSWYGGSMTLAQMWVAATVLDGPSPAHEVGPAAVGAVFLR